MHIGLATCAQLPNGDPDEQFLSAAITRRGHSFARPVWNDGDVDWSSFDACLIRTTWDYHERHEDFARWVDRVASVAPVYNEPAVIRWNAVKDYLFRLEARGIPIIPSIRLETPRDLAGLVADRGWSRAFLKPEVGAGAFGTLRFDADQLSEAQVHLEEWVTRTPMLLQPYLAEVETAGEISVMVIDGVITHAVRKVPVPGDYRVQDDHGATDEPMTLDDGLVEVTNRVLAAIDEPVLYARVDLLHDHTERLVTEVELIEPSLFFRHCPEAADRLVDGLLRRLTTRAKRGVRP